MADTGKIGDSIAAQFRGLNGRPPAQWPVVPRVLCGVAVLIGVIIAGWAGYLKGQQEEIDAGRQAEEQLREAYRSKVRQAVNLEGLRQQKEQVNKYVAALEKQLPSKAEMDALLSDINQAGLGRGLQFDLFKPGQSLVKDYYAELPISIRITGSYHDVGAFTTDIAKLPRIVTLNDLSLAKGKDNTLVLDAVAKTFRYLDADEIAAQRKAVKGRAK